MKAVVELELEESYLLSNRQTRFAPVQPSHPSGRRGGREGQHRGGNRGRQDWGLPLPALPFVRSNGRKGGP